MTFVRPREFAMARGEKPQRSSACGACRERRALPFDFTMAFQRIVDIERGRVWAYEAFVRVTAGQGADNILSQVEPALI